MRVPPAGMAGRSVAGCGGIAMPFDPPIRYYKTGFDLRQRRCLGHQMLKVGQPLCYPLFVRVPKNC